MPPEKQRSKFVVCIRDSGSGDLETRKVYQVLADRAAAKEGYLRVVDESGEDYLYPAEYFGPVGLPAAAAREMVRPRPAAGASASPARARLRG
jgi:hypothetical protein